MSRSRDERLADIRAAIQRCFAYREFLEVPEFASMAYDAVLRNLAVIGEAVKTLPDDFKIDHPEVPWPSIAGLRNVVVHEYFRVNHDVIRDILTEPLAQLADAVADDAAEAAPTTLFVESAGRGIELQLGDEWPGFNEALVDSVSSLPYRGEGKSGLSTYWIDLLTSRLENWVPDAGDEMAILNGNVTELVRSGPDLIARSLYDLFDDERLPVKDLLPLLREWRARVVAGGADFAIPETYRRAPFPLGSVDTP